MVRSTHQIFLTDNELFLVVLETFISIAMTQDLNLDYGKWVKKNLANRKKYFSWIIKQINFISTSYPYSKISNGWIKCHCHVPCRCSNWKFSMDCSTGSLIPCTFIVNNIGTRIPQHRTKQQWCCKFKREILESTFKCFRKNRWNNL